MSWLRLSLMALVALAGCAPAEGTGTPLPSLDLSHPAAAMDDVVCDRLASEQEVEAIVGRDLTALGRSFSSCYWTGFLKDVQLVFNTGAQVEAWRTSLLETYTDRAEVDGLELWAERGSDSVAAFGPDRGLIVHGLSDHEAAQLLRLALPRL